MLGELKELWKFRELLLSMIERELRIRYKNSFLGFFWSLLNPLITVLVMTLVFKFILPLGVPNLSAYILAAYLPYMFFQIAVMDSSQSVLAALPLVRKIYFPREVLPLAMICSNFIHFLLALVVFFFYLLGLWLLFPGGGFPLQWTAVYLPILLVINFALASGLGLLVSALNVFYEDVKYLVSVALYLLFFLSPIMYFSENVWHGVQTGRIEGWLYTLYHANPVAMLATAYRKTLLPAHELPVRDGNEVTMVESLPLDWWMLGLAALTSFVILWFGYWTFNRLKWKFVERP